MYAVGTILMVSGGGRNVEVRRGVCEPADKKKKKRTDEKPIREELLDELLADRALILLGFAGAFRRFEHVGLDVEDCEFGKDGLTITLRHSKTDQQGAGRKIGIPYGSNPGTCPVPRFGHSLNRLASAPGRSPGPPFICP